MAYEEWITKIWGTHYLKAILIFVLAIIIMQIVVFISERIFLRLAKKTKTDVDDIIVEKTKFPLALLVLFVGARLASESLLFGEAIMVPIEKIIGSLIILALTRIIVIIVDTIIENWGATMAKRTKSSVDDDLIKLFQKFSNVAIYIIGVMYVLSAWGIEIGPLLASLGIAGVAVAFALQNTLGNIFGGVSLILDKTFRVGDVIQLDDGTIGTVRKVSIRSTKIRTFANELVTVPNGKLADSKITNWYMPDLMVRIAVPIGVEYGSNPDKVKKIALDIVKKDKQILKKPEPYILFREMGDFSLNFSLRFWIEDITQKIIVKDRIVSELYSALNKSKIGIPFPTQTLHLKK